MDSAQWIPVTVFYTIRPSKSHHSTGSILSRPRCRCYLSKIRFFVVDQWFLLALGFFILLASQVQVRGSQHKKKENRCHISPCGNHLLHYRMHATHKSTSCKLQPLEAPHFYPDTVFPCHVCYRIRCRPSMYDKPRLHGCRTPSRHDIHRMCANHHLFQRYDDEASEWQSSFDRGTVYAGQLSWAVHIAITNIKCI